jgi:hypothetical protein
MLSPLSAGYRQEIVSLAETLNRVVPGSIDARPFECMASGAALLEWVAAEFGRA